MPSTVNVSPQESGRTPDEGGSRNTPAGAQKPGLLARLKAADADGRPVIAFAAWLTIVVPIGVDGVLLARAHMNNPLWLPHAKLHCAMSFFAAIFLGASSLVLLKARPASDKVCMALAAFLATSFWIGLIAAGFWPGTAYNFKNDPAVYVAPPRVLGIPIDVNVATAIVAIIIGWWGFYHTTRRPEAKGATP